MIVQHLYKSGTAAVPCLLTSLSSDAIKPVIERARAMECKVEAMLAGKKSSIPADDREEEDAMAMASSSASPAAIFAFLAPPLSLLRHVACLCAGYLGLDGKPSVPLLLRRRLQLLLPLVSETSSRLLHP